MSTAPTPITRADTGAGLASPQRVRSRILQASVGYQEANVRLARSSDASRYRQPSVTDPKSGTPRRLGVTSGISSGPVLS
jgi:hypothetical protein